MKTWTPKKCMSCDYIMKTPTGFRKCIKCRQLQAREKKALREEKALDRKLGSKKYQVAQTKMLKKKLWKLVSQYVRSKDADENGRVACFTCGESSQWKEMHCGHFHHNKQDYNLDNLRCQCIKCNYFKSGAYGIFATKLATEIGLERLNKLLLDCNTKGNNYTISELEELVKKYKLLLSNL